MPSVCRHTARRLHEHVGLVVHAERRQLVRVLLLVFGAEQTRIALERQVAEVQSRIDALTARIEALAAQGN